MKNFLIWFLFIFACFSVADAILPPMPSIEIRFLDGEKE